MSRRSLWPREHGAYFQLAIPLLTALGRQVPTLAMVALSAGAVLAFAANEPLLIVLGHRGARRRAADGRRATTRVALLAIAAAGLGATGLALAPTATLVAAALVGVPVAALLVLAVRRGEHTLGGELVAAVALTGACVPIEVAGTGVLAHALTTWLAWAAGFAASVIAVHHVLARHRRDASWRDVAVSLGVGASCAAMAMARGPLLLTVPLLALATILVAVPPAARRLRAVGVAIVVAALAGTGLTWFGVAG